jgi:protein-disulfide isomerase
MAAPKNTTYTWILLAGIVLGFLIAEAVLVIKNPPQNTAEPAITTQQTQIPQTQQSQQTNPADEIAIQQKFFDTVKNVSPDDDPWIGNADAKLTVIEFTDFQCPYCKKYFDESFGQIKKTYIDTGKIKYVLRDFPLEEHPQALLAAQTANCAGKQNKYWEMHDMLFTYQDSWSYKDNSADIFKSYAKNLGLDEAKFDECMKNKDIVDEIAKDIKDGQLYGVNRTPTIFVGEKKIVGAQPFSTTFKVVIDQELKKITEAQTPQ